MLHSNPTSTEKCAISELQMWDILTLRVRNKLRIIVVMLILRDFCRYDLSQYNLQLQFLIKKLKLFFIIQSPTKGTGPDCKYYSNAEDG
jgi:hypothetical protein